jgi:heterodisulfide reductase subunit C
VLLGLKEFVLSSDELWMCAACFTCEERCVQEVNFTDVVTVLRNMAVKEGKGAKGYISMARGVLENGRVSVRTGTVDRMREQLGLPPIQDPAITDIQTIAEATGFYDILAMNKEGDEE